VVANSTAGDLVASARTVPHAAVGSAVMQNSLNIHKHLIIRAEVNNPPTDPKMLEQWLKDFIGFIDMKIMMGPYVAYCDKEGNRGITGIAVIETSHIAMHVWDEPVPAMMQLDVYSCAEFDPYRIADKLKQDFDVVKLDYKFLNRETGLRPIRLKKSQF
jgi:S-adenosylmethionine/arginine decarboxylase-like enzyme